MRLPFIFALSCVLLVSIDVAVKGRFNYSAYNFDDYLIVLFMASIIVSSILSQNALSLNYIAAYCFVLGILYLFLKGALFSYVPVESIYAVNAFAVVFVGVFMCINFALNTAGIIDLQGMMPRIRPSTATYAGIFNRGYGFSTEPGIVAFYFNTLGPLAVWYLWKRSSIPSSLVYLLTIFIIIGWLLTFSASGVAFLAIAIMFGIFLSRSVYRGLRFARNRLYNFTLLLPLLIAVSVWMFDRFNIGRYFSPIYMKLSLSSELSTSSTRLDRWSAGLQKFLNLDNPLFGYGPGYFSSIDELSTLSWYLMVLVESGLISFLLIIVFFGLVFIRIVYMRHQARSAFLIGFVAGCGHLLVISTFYHPFIWLLMAILYVQLAHIRIDIKQSVVP